MPACHVTKIMNGFLLKETFSDTDWQKLGTGDIDGFITHLFDVLRKDFSKFIQRESQPFLDWLETYSPQAHGQLLAQRQVLSFSKSTGAEPFIPDDRNSFRDMLETAKFASGSKSFKKIIDAFDQHFRSPKQSFYSAFFEENRGFTESLLSEFEQHPLENLFVSSIAKIGKLN